MHSSRPTGGRHTSKSEKMKHRDVIETVKRNSIKPAKEPTGLKSEIIKLVKEAGPTGLTTDELKTRISHRHPQTVNSATNALAKADVLKDSTKRRETSSGGGRPAIVYVFNPSSKSAQVVDLGARKVPGLIEQLGVATDRMSHHDRIEVAWKVTKRLHVATSQVSQREYYESKRRGELQPITLSK